MALSDKLNLLQLTKEDIKSAIVEKGQDIPSGAAFSTYADKIRSIESGGGDYEISYEPGADPGGRPKGMRGHRNLDWLPMPEMSDTQDEINILFAVYPNGSNIFNMSLTTHSGVTGTITVDWGDGNIDDRYSSHTYDFETLDPSTLTGDGYRQAMIKVRAPRGLYRGFGDYRGWLPKEVLEINANVGNLVALFPGGYDPKSIGHMVERVIIKGEKTVTQIGSMGYGMVSYVKIDVFKNVSLRLGLIGGVGLPNVISVDFDTFAPLSASSMFDGCSLLDTTPKIDLSNITIPRPTTSNLDYLFGHCLSLNHIRNVDLSKTNGRNIFTSYVGVEDAPSVKTITFKPGTFTESLILSRQLLNKDALNDVFEATEVVTASRVLDVSFNPGSERCDPSIAQAKGWTVIV